MRHTDLHFCFVAGRAAVRRCAWLDKYIAMPLFQSLDASQFVRIASANLPWSGCKIVLKSIRQKSYFLSLLILNYFTVSERQQQGKPISYQVDPVWICSRDQIFEAWWINIIQKIFFYKDYIRLFVTGALEELEGPAISALQRAIAEVRNVGYRKGDQKCIISSSSVLRKAR
jgi:hypothetical protein